MWDTIS